MRSRSNSPPVLTVPRRLRFSQVAPVTGNIMNCRKQSVKHNACMGMKPVSVSVLWIDVLEPHSCYLIYCLFSVNDDQVSQLSRVNNTYMIVPS